MFRIQVQNGDNSGKSGDSASVKTTTTISKNGDSHW